MEQLANRIRHRLTELERTRTRKLVNQQWSTVLEIEAKIDECNLTLQFIAQQESETNEPKQ